MIKYTLGSTSLATVRGQEDYTQRIKNMEISIDEWSQIKNNIDYIGVTENFKDVITTFSTDPNQTPAGFRRELVLDGNVLKVDLVRDISYDSDGELRPTNVLFSADSANPYEIVPMKNLISNLTCNPGIVYDLFINNPEANIGNQFKDRDEVMTEIAKILGPGVDISVELNNPFEKNFDTILEEAEKFKNMFSKHRVVIKVPHTGVVTSENVNELMLEDKKLSRDFKNVSTEDSFYSHNLCLKLREAGYRINYTLMFEPYQTNLALQAKPYFINTFLRQRLVQSETIQNYVKIYDLTKDITILKNLYTFNCMLNGR